MQKSQKENVVFEEGSWGVDIYEGLEPCLENGDVIVSKHWSSRSDLFVIIVWLKTEERLAHSRTRISTISFGKGTSRIL